MMPIIGPSPRELAVLASTARRRILYIVSQAGKGHIASSFSCVDILVALYYGALRVSPSNLSNVHRDRFILSKGHAAEALYAVLELRGFLTSELVSSYGATGSSLHGHPPPTLPGIEHATGSLGHGLSVATGMSLGLRLFRSTARVFVLVGDGELVEGSNWEAILAAAHFRLGNLCVIVDLNHAQISGSTGDVMNIDPLCEKLAAFGWAVNTINGHDYNALCRALDFVSCADGRPTAILAETTKGKGVSFIEGNLDWHSRVPTHSELAAACRELSGR